jgi:FKBP-type peptidyl-prolyl cis-trans isomerase (trigger factor)
MISPRLSILMVAMSVVGVVSPMAAMAQETEENTAANILDQANTAANVADTSADDNVQVNNAEVSQSIANVAACDDKCGPEVETGDNTNVAVVDQENEIETGDVEQTLDADQSNTATDVVQVALAGLELEF